MNDMTKAWGDNWLAAQQAMWKGFTPWSAAPGGTDAAPAPPEGSPLEAQFAELRDTWQNSVAKWTEFAKDAPVGKLPSPETLREMFTPASWTGPGAGVMDTALQRVLEGPRYATLWDLDRKMLELQQATLQRDKDVAAYQAVVQKAWNTAFERFSRGLVSAPDASRKLSWRGLTDQWLAVANDTLIEVHRSDAFMQAQSRMLRSASERHLKERAIAEAWSEAAHLPTRTEVDELQRQVVELRRELRALRRASAPAPAVPAKAPARTAAKRATTKRK